MEIKSEDAASPPEPSTVPSLPAFHLRNLKLTRFFLNQLLKRLKVSVRVHDLTDQFWAGGGIVVANHFTRFETFVLPHVLYQKARVKLRILAHHSFFQNRFFGDYLRSVGALPSNTPGKFELIARDILQGGPPPFLPDLGLMRGRNAVVLRHLRIYDHGI